MTNISINQKSAAVQPRTEQAAAAKTGSQTGGVNRASVENRVEVQAKETAKTEVKKEEAGKSAAEEMRKENTAITAQPDEGIRLEISKKGLEKEQEGIRSREDDAAKTGIRPAQDEDKKAEDDKDAAKQRIEEQQKVKEKIREMTDREVDKEQQDVRQAERREQEKQDDRVEEERESEDEKKQQNITNYSGYTSAQLQQMVNNGEISRNDYRKEIENREEKREEQVQSVNETDKKITEGIGRAERTERSMNAIDTAFDEESNNNVNAETRTEILQNLEDPTRTSQGQENIQREQQAQAFARWQNDFGFLIR